jgi:hypothetical protein
MRAPTSRKGKNTMKQAHHRILGLSAFLASLACLAACSSDSGDKGGNANAGSAGTSKGTGGAKNSGGSGGTSDGKAGAPATVIDGKAIAKFCNLLAGPKDETLTLTLTVGSGADAVEFTAKSGECSPPKPTPCTPIPAGTGIPMVLSMGDQGIVSVLVPQIVKGDETLILGTIDEASNEPTLQAGKIKAEFKCNEITLDEEGGAGSGGQGGAAGSSNGGASNGGSANGGSTNGGAAGQVGVGGSSAGGSSSFYRGSFTQRDASRSWFENGLLKLTRLR